MPLSDHSNSTRLARDSLVLGPSAALNRDPTASSTFNNTSQTFPQLFVPQPSATSQPPRLVSRSGQLQEQGFFVEVADRIAAPQRSSTRKMQRKFGGLLHSICETDFRIFLLTVPRPKQAPLDYRWLQNCHC